MAKKIKKRELYPPFQWNALEYEYFPKSADWFWMIIILTLSIAIASFILGNFLFGVLILVSGFSIILFGLRKPQNVVFSITGRGVQIDDKLYPYNTLESFWIYYNPPVQKQITLKSKKIFMPSIQIPLGDADPNIARNFLLKFMQEKEHPESLTDSVLRILKF